MTGSEEDDEFTVESESGSEGQPSDSEGNYCTVSLGSLAVLALIMATSLVTLECKPTTTMQTEFTDNLCTYGNHKY